MGERTSLWRSGTVRANHKDDNLRMVSRDQVSFIMFISASCHRLPWQPQWYEFDAKSDILWWYLILFHWKPGHRENKMRSKIDQHICFPDCGSEWWFVISSLKRSGKIRECRINGLKTSNQMIRVDCIKNCFIRGFNVTRPIINLKLIISNGYHRTSGKQDCIQRVDWVQTQCYLWMN